MYLVIDCEWNGYGGDLTSLALVPFSLDGPEFYEVLPCPNPCDWVAENVIPVLKKNPISYRMFQHYLQQYLAQFSRVIVFADWPEDIAYFCNALITGPGTRIALPQLRFALRPMDAESEVPHNALWDARGIRDVLLAEIQQPHPQPR